jgi:toxin FitB
VVLSFLGGPDLPHGPARLNVPDPLPVIDGLLAASARARGWTLVTRNTADLARCGFPVINPFDPSSGS